MSRRYQSFQGTGPSGGNLVGTYANRPGSARAGTLYIPTDGPTQFLYDGTKWRPIAGGVLGTEVAPANSISAFSQVGLAPDAVNVQGGCLYFQKNNVNGNSLCAYEKPKTAGQTLKLHLRCQTATSGSVTHAIAYAGAYVRDTVGGKVEGIFVGPDGVFNGSSCVNVYQWSALNTFVHNAAATSTPVPSDGFWLQVQDTGSSLVFGYSVDGINFIALYTDTATYLGTSNYGNAYGVASGADAVGIGVSLDAFAVS